MAKYSTGTYTPKNPSKYAGNKLPTWRSGWEAKFMEFCDSHPNILAWSSENVKIPYMHPLTGKIANYIPDFMVQYIDKNGKEFVEIIEIKPSTQSTNESARSQRDRTQVVINSAKWASAQAYCKQRGIKFKVINEDSIFKSTKPRIKKPRINKPRKTK